MMSTGNQYTIINQLFHSVFGRSLQNSMRILASLSAHPNSFFTFSRKRVLAKVMGFNGGVLGRTCRSQLQRHLQGRLQKEKRGCPRLPGTPKAGPPTQPLACLLAFSLEAQPRKKHPKASKASCRKLLSEALRQQLEMASRLNVQPSGAGPVSPLPPECHLGSVGNNMENIDDSESEIGAWNYTVNRNSAM